MKYLDQGHGVNQVLSLAGISKSSFYYRSSDGHSGRKPSTRTYHYLLGWVNNSLVTDEITKLISQPYVDYGCVKVTEYLKQNHYHINHKKVERLMREEGLLLPSRRNGSGREYVKITVPEPGEPLEHLEMDIKVIYVQGENRNAYQLSVVDLFHRECLGFRLGYTMRKTEVVSLIGEILEKYQMSRRGDSPVFSIRTDNGAQFISRVVRDYMGSSNILQEFTRPATPQQNGHIEAFHSVMEKALIRRYEFDSLDHLRYHMTLFMAFYNNERLHSALCYRPPLKFLKLWQEGKIGRKRNSKGRLINFFKETEPRALPPLKIM